MMVKEVVTMRRTKIRYFTWLVLTFLIPCRGVVTAPLVKEEIVTLEISGMT